MGKRHWRMRSHDPVWLRFLFSISTSLKKTRFGAMLLYLNKDLMESGRRVEPYGRWTSGTVRSRKTRVCRDPSERRFLKLLTVLKTSREDSLPTLKSFATRVYFLRNRLFVKKKAELVFAPLIEVWSSPRGSHYFLKPLVFEKIKIEFDSLKWILHRYLSSVKRPK